MSDDFWNAEKESFAEYKARKTSHSKSLSQPNSLRNQHGKCKYSKLEKHKCKCRTCINRRSRNKGRRKQNLVRKKLKIPNNKFYGADAHEENWSAGFRVEVKAGKQVQPVATLFYKCKAQSDTAHNAIGGKSKPFIQVSMPDNSTNGIVSFELDDIENICVEVLKNFGYSFGD